MGNLTRISLCALTLVLLVGCTYLENRVEDALDMADFGLSFSAKPQFEVFVDAPFATVYPIGYGDVDGYFLGVGQGKMAGFSKSYRLNYGVVLWGHEELSFKASKDELAAMSGEERKNAEEYYHTGLGGFAQDQSFPPPKYLVSCPHYVHLGWVGVVATPRWWEMLDFVVGWTTLDVSFDDDADEVALREDRPWRPWHRQYVSPKMAAEPAKEKK